MESPLVVWIQTLGPLGSPDGVSSEERVNLFMELVDGVFLHKIMTQIDPSPTNQRLNKNVNNDVSLRLYNLTVLTRQIRSYYQETLRQLIVMTLPDVLCIAKDPLSGNAETHTLTLSVCLCVCVCVQCERKEEMIEKIKLLDIQTQAAIVSHIQEVTHNQLNVLDLSWLEEGAELTPDDLDPLSRNMAVSLRQLIEQREKANEVILDLTQERDFLSSQQPRDGYRSLGVHSPEQRLHSGGLVGANGGPVMSGPEHTKEEKHHLSVELADNKAKLRRFRQELEEKTEQLMDSKHEAERLNQELQRLRQENQSLSTEARFVRAYQDEMDSMKERAARVDRLEAELTRCKEKLNDVHFYKSRVEELRGDNLTLMETKVLLEDQLSASRGRCEKLHAVEKDNLLMRAKIHDVEMERDSERRRLEELVEENMLLEIGQKQSMNESAHLGWELEQLAKNHDNTETRKSLIHELNEGVSSRLLKLEKENRELQDSIEKLREEKNQLQGQLLSTQELERENQGLGKKLESLQGMVDQERLTNQDMESLGEELLKEKQTLERELQVLRAEKDRQMSELEHERQHLSEAVTSLRERAQANSEACVREVEAENRQLHQALTDVGSQLASLESQLKLANEEAVCLQEKARRCEEVEREAVRLEQCRDGLNREVGEGSNLLAGELREERRRREEAEEERRRIVTDLEQSEKERKGMEKETWRLRNQLEAKEAELEEKEACLTKARKESGAQGKELERLKEASVRVKELERDSKELQKQATIDLRTLATLREELVSEKLNGQQQNLELESLNQELEKVGLNRERLLQQEHSLEDSSLLKEQLKQLDNQNSSLNSQMAAQQRHTVLLQEQNTSLHTQTARLQVENSTLSSQSASLMAQNAVLQGQVVALETEVESWHRQRDEAWQGRENVLSDHERLLNVHERQAHEYEQLISQHASLKVKQRALEGEHRALYCSLLQHKEKWEAQEGRGQKEKEELNQEVENNRLLQQESLQLKAEVDRMTQSQSQHNAEIEGLQHRNNELKSLLSSAKTETSQCMKQYDSLMEQHRVVDLSKVKLDNHCELLSRLKGNLEEENHHLLSQISLLSQQNHALLERSMESKELYHAEQKLYIDKLNALRRHKEKLEEKIMDQYKFHDPTPKKRSHWSGAKALAKLIKPRKESGSRDKDEDWERARSAPDIPLPSPPPLLLPNDDHPPPLPPRMGSDTPDNGSQVFNQHSSPVLMSPALTPGGRGNSMPSFSPSDRHRHTQTSDRHCRSSSLSSDDVMALSKSQPSLSRSSTLPYDHTPQRAQPQRGTSGFRAKPPRSSSPGSEMVSLEQFLQESNIQSPPTVSTGSKEDLMADYFTRSPALSAPAEREQALPTHYVTPTVQPGNQRPGQNVKPFPRLPVGQTPSQSPSRAYSQSPSRAYSLASADLLRSNGADVYRADDSPLGQPEVLLRRPGGPTNGSQRPLSACVAGSGSLPGEGGCPTAPLHHSSSFNLQTERYAEREREREREGVPTSISTTSLSYHHRGEVAMVSPVRAVQAPRSDDEPEQREGLREGRAADSSHNDKGGEIARCASAERLDSKPASPDPNNDPQTVWYEYGCV
uniref:Calponin-homology (CH) domain-containing protein n=1 Tax=Gadus morhua TaxID=8049 RepID=A0A8C5ARC8_GADMO